MPVVKGRADILIHADAAAVFDFVATDFITNYRRWSPEVQHLELLTPGPLRIGSRARQIRVDQGRRSDTVFRVTAMDKPQRISFVEQSRQFETEYRFDPVGGRARLHFQFELTRLELYMRPFEKLIRIAIQDGAERVVHNIKRLIEKDLAQPMRRQGQR